MNYNAIRAIYRFEMARAGRTLMQSLISRQRECGHGALDHLVGNLLGQRQPLVLRCLARQGTPAPARHAPRFLGNLHIQLTRLLTQHRNLRAVVR